jgi:flagella basal body P-ring formation protein FlgA
MRKFIFFLICFFVECEAVPFSVSKDEVLEILRAELSQKITTHDFQVSLDNWSDAWGKSKNLKEAPLLSLTELSLVADQRRFTTILNIGEKFSRKLIGRIDWLIEIPVLTNPINSNFVITESDISWQKFPADRITSTMAAKKEDLLGKTSRRGVLKLGMPINLNELQSPVVIKKGDTVQVSYKSRALEITARALAKSDGSIGEMIYFEPLSQSHNGNEPNRQKKIIQAKVVGPSLAEIVRLL